MTSGLLAGSLADPIPNGTAAPTAMEDVALRLFYLIHSPPLSMVALVRAGILDASAEERGVLRRMATGSAPPDSVQRTEAEKKAINEGTETQAALLWTSENATSKETMTANGSPRARTRVSLSSLNSSASSSSNIGTAAATSLPYRVARLSDDAVAAQLASLYARHPAYELRECLHRVAMRLGRPSYQDPASNDIIATAEALRERDRLVTRYIDLYRALHPATGAASGWNEAGREHRDPVLATWARELRFKMGCHHTQQRHCPHGALDGHRRREEHGNSESASPNTASARLRVRQLTSKAETSVALGFVRELLRNTPHSAPRRLPLRNAPNNIPARGEMPGAVTVTLIRPGTVTPAGWGKSLTTPPQYVAGRDQPPKEGVHVGDGARLVVTSLDCMLGLPDDANKTAISQPSPGQPHMQQKGGYAHEVIAGAAALQKVSPTPSGSTGMGNATGPLVPSRGERRRRRRPRATGHPRSSSSSSSSSSVSLSVVGEAEDDLLLLSGAEDGAEIAEEDEEEESAASSLDDDRSEAESAGRREVSPAKDRHRRVSPLPLSLTDAASPALASRTATAATTTMDFLTSHHEGLKTAATAAKAVNPQNNNTKEEPRTTAAQMATSRSSNLGPTAEVSVLTSTPGSPILRGYTQTRPFTLSELTPTDAMAVLQLPFYAQAHELDRLAGARRRSCYQDPYTQCLILSSYFLRTLPHCYGEYCKHCPHGEVCERRQLQPLSTPNAQRTHPHRRRHCKRNLSDPRRSVLSPVSGTVATLTQVWQDAVESSESDDASSSACWTEDDLDRRAADEKEEEEARLFFDRLDAADPVAPHATVAVDPVTTRPIEAHELDLRDSLSFGDSSASVSASSFSSSEAASFMEVEEREEDSHRRRPHVRAKDAAAMSFVPGAANTAGVVVHVNSLRELLQWGNDGGEMNTATAQVTGDGQAGLHKGTTGGSGQEEGKRAGNGFTITGGQEQLSNAGGNVSAIETAAAPVGKQTKEEEEEAELRRRVASFDRFSYLDYAAL